ncbi:MAG: hypothetical protein ACU0EF_12725, partial [Roseovarius sp.]
MTEPAIVPSLFSLLRLAPVTPPQQREGKVKIRVPTAIYHAGDSPFRKTLENPAESCIFRSDTDRGIKSD